MMLCKHDYYHRLNSSNQHEEKSEFFINTLKKYENDLIESVQVVNDFSLMTENNTVDIIDIDFSDYDLVFSLGIKIFNNIKIKIAFRWGRYILKDFIFSY